MSNDKARMSSLDYHISLRQAPVGSQMFFVAFGALVLVPLLTGMDPNVAMFTAGVGTLVFQVLTRGKVPIFLASSFAFILPIQVGIKQWGLPGTLCGLTVSGVMYLVISFLVRRYGSVVIQRFLPPIVTGPVIMVIGLSLAPTAVNMAFGVDSSGAQVMDRHTALALSMIALAATLTATLWGRGVVRLIPILCGIAAGYIAALCFGVVNFAPMEGAPWLAVPHFTLPQWNTQAVLYIVPIVIAPIIEHVGNVVAIGNVTGRDYTKTPGLHKTLFGDGIATMLASFLGGPPCTTYSEVTGGIALTRAFNPAVLTWAAITAILLGFVGKLGSALMTIPMPVMGGIMVLLFGAIVVVGINSLVMARLDLMEPRNMVIIAVVLVFGLGGMVFEAGDFAIRGIGLAGLSGFVLNLILPAPVKAP